WRRCAPLLWTRPAGPGSRRSTPARSRSWRTVWPPSWSRSWSGSPCPSPTRPPPATPNCGSRRRSWWAGWRVCSTGSRPRCSPSRWRRVPSWSRCAGRSRPVPVTARRTPTSAVARAARTCNGPPTRPDNRKGPGSPGPFAVRACRAGETPGPARPGRAALGDLQGDVRQDLRVGGVGGRRGLLADRALAVDVLLHVDDLQVAPAGRLEALLDRLDVLELEVREPDLVGVVVGLLRLLALLLVDRL